MSNKTDTRYNKLRLLHIRSNTHLGNFVKSWKSVIGDRLFGMPPASRDIESMLDSFRELCSIHDEVKRNLSTIIRDYSGQSEEIDRRILSLLSRIEDSTP